MTDYHCTASIADLENPPHPNVRPLFRVAEEESEYNTDAPTAIRLSTDRLRAYLSHRLKQHDSLSIRVLTQLNDLDIHLQKEDAIDIFDLLVEHTLIGDHFPAQIISDLLAVLDDDALLNLEPRTIAHAGEFLRDVLKHKMIRWHLREYQQEQQIEQEPEE